ncbi:DNA glycosylase [Aaosphaeria arxii CBS 175.79]|uniref:Endonuclease III homolog n=1 Tax=Aaosphaeria arxii CBS 175.79 TaxID=1450172 RepID=A0A6A5XPQ9_9PLEO|nr:DNA glycosylase [Aaosphaeria arxii CBS 175.79]KAF2014896.1 DNA glycosylase [Aaosphaeria arxii CBS 175.79]
MRTSRISRDTSKIIAASRARRPLRRAPSATNVATQDLALNTPDANPVAKVRNRESASSQNNGFQSSDSELSSPAEDQDSDFSNTITSKKRKRGQDVPVPPRVKQESKEVSIATIASPKRENGKPKKARRVPAKKTVVNGVVKVEAPPNWEEMYALTREMRNENVAPVDTMGCESLADRTASPRDQRFQTLVSLMLSSQTKDTVTSVAIKGMQDNMPGGFNLESVLAIEPQALNAFICKVGFHNLKTKYIKSAAEILRDKWNSDIPDSIAGLVSLPGVGPKMAYLCMSAAWGRDEGIGVDVHVHRISNLWGWNNTKQPEETRAALESWLPKDRWHDINNLLVGFGQTICLPVGRKCGDCKLADRGLCPSAVVGKSTKVKKEETIVKLEGTGGSTVVHDELTVSRGHDIKSEDVADIEDMGLSLRTRRARKGKPSPFQFCTNITTIITRPLLPTLSTLPTPDPLHTNFPSSHKMDGRLDPVANVDVLVMLDEVLFEWLETSLSPEEASALGLTPSLTATVPAATSITSVPHMSAGDIGILSGYIFIGLFCLLFGYILRVLLQRV